uniref:universal stress protein n=1 Tax=Caballeronia choica TaxID=326476 RepID=UPI002E10D023
MTTSRTASSRAPRNLVRTLVVIGTHGRRLALGSVGEHFLRTSCCPVLLVPAPKGELQAEAASEKLDTQTPH